MECSVGSIPIEKSGIIARLNNGRSCFAKILAACAGAMRLKLIAKAKNRVAARPRMQEPNLIPA